MSKNKFRALLFLIIVIGGMPSVNIYQGEPLDNTLNLTYLVIDIIVQAVIISAYLVSFVFAAHYGIKAWDEDEKPKKL